MEINLLDNGEIDVRVADQIANSKIRAGALESVKVVATDTASALVAALGGKDDADAVAAAVAKRTEG